MGIILIWFLQQLKKKKFSRLDLAFDMIDVDVKGYLPYVFGASKSLFMIVLGIQERFMRELSSKSQIDFMMKSREKHAGYEVKDLSFFGDQNYNSEEIEPKFGEMTQKNWVNFINWSQPHGVKNLITQSFIIGDEARSEYL